MSTQIQHLQDFIDVVQLEFFTTHPDVYRDFVHLLGLRIQQLQVGRLDELEYIRSKPAKTDALAGILDELGQ